MTKDDGMVAPTASPSLAWIQVLRAVAAIAVTFVHVWQEFIRAGLRSALPDLYIGNAGVDLFFVISGFIIVYSSENLYGRADAPKLFFLRRCARIVPLYWAISTIVLAYVLIRYNDLTSVNFSRSWVVASYLFVPYPQLDGNMLPLHGVGWTLNYEMFFYAAFSIAVLARRQIAVVGVGSFLAALVAAGRLFAPLPQPLAFWSDPLILEFVLGMLIALVLRRRPHLPKYAAPSLAVAGAALFAAEAVWGSRDLPQVVAWGVPAALLVGGAAFAGTPGKTGFLWRALKGLGDASYALYLVHPLAITLPRRLFSHLVDPAAFPWLNLSLQLIIAVGAAVLVHRWFEKPLTRALQPKSLCPTDQHGVPRASSLARPRQRTGDRQS